MYEPTLARFMSRDPLPEDGVDIFYPVPDMRKYYQRSSHNFYAYVSNNPANMADPSGLQEQPPEASSGPGGGVFGIEDKVRATVTSIVDAFEQGFRLHMRMRNVLGRAPCQFEYFRYDRVDVHVTYSSGGLWCQVLAYLADGTAERVADRALESAFPISLGLDQCPCALVCDRWQCTVNAKSLPIPSVPVASGGCGFTVGGRIDYTHKSCSGTCVAGGSGFPPGLPPHEYPDPTEIPPGPRY